MAKKSDRSLELLSDLLSTAKKIGVAGTSALLKNASSKIDPKEHRKNAVVDFIITKVCDHFTLSRKELLHGTSHGERVDALRICFVICRKTLKSSNKEISNFFKKDRGNISRDIHKFNMFSTDNKLEKAQIDFCSNTVVKVKEYIEQLETDG